ncbi:MAG: prolipoprotein diacylglyceryl transferase [Tunicatimonas sp.]
MLAANFTLGYIFWNPDPVLIDFGFYALRWYGVLFATGIALSYGLVRSGFRKAGLADRLFDQFAFVIVMGMFVGMRLGHFLFYEPMAFVERPIEVLLPVSFTPEFHFTGYQGLASHGGAIGILLAVGWFAREHRPVSGAFVLNQLAVVAPLVGGFIRLGNLMNSEIIGRPTTVPWAFVFASADQLPRHPAQLYEALGYFAIFVLLFSWQRQPKFQQQGRLFGVLLVLLFGWRFFVEFFKEDQEAFEQALWLNMGQLLSLPFVIGGALIWYLSRRSETGSHR